MSQPLPPTPGGEPIEEYATALPQTAQPTAPEPADDGGHLLPDDVWATVVADAEKDPS
jgi:hypothetical protein